MRVIQYIVLGTLALLINTSFADNGQTVITKTKITNSKYSQNMLEFWQLSETEFEEAERIKDKLGNLTSVKNE